MPEGGLTAEGAESTEEFREVRLGVLVVLGG